MSEHRLTSDSLSIKEATVSNMPETRGDAMIEWLSYSGHNIKVCSQSLADARWLPLAVIWKSVDKQELFNTVSGEPVEI